MYTNGSSRVIRGMERGGVVRKARPNAGVDLSRI